MKTKHKLLGFVSILTILFGILLTSRAVHATEITNYSNTASITKADGTAITAAQAIDYWEPLSVSNNITFPDEQEIKAGDTLTITLPPQLRFTTTLSFDVMHTNGELAGKATVDPFTQKATVTFTDIFERLPLDKAMSLNFNVQINHDNVVVPNTINFVYSGTAYAVFVNENTVVPISPALNKTGYQDENDPSIIHWKVLINSNQASVDNLTLRDIVGPDQYILKETLLAVRSQYIEGDPIDSFDEAASRPYAEDFSKNVTYENDVLGQAIGFTYTIPTPSNNAIYITYDTKLTKSQAVGTDMSNTIAISGNNIKYFNETAYARIEAAYGAARSRVRRNIVTTTTTETTTTSQTTSTTSTTTEATTTSGTQTTTESGTSQSSTSSGTTTGTGSTTSTLPSTTVVTKSQKRLPATGDETGVWLMALGLTLLAGVYFRHSKVKS
ncbi:collagen binding domain-containing protein [Streptococcus ferus]|uniref:collagen binding domain-containing protein n=1 Tax=Streptococcus ferus TaxID=1345 RepID=UPI0035A06446